MKIPAALARIISKAGGHTRGLKVLVYGSWKTGKSFFLASMPRPIIAAACIDPGIEPYLEPTQWDEDKGWAGGDVCFHIQSFDEFEEFLDFALENQGKIGSVVIDNLNLLWTAHLDAMQESFGGDIKPHHWPKIKGPWKRALYRLAACPVNVGASVWLKDILYAQDAAPPGVEGKVRPVSQDNPDTEKNVPYIFDLIFKTEVERDGQNRPTSKHNVIFYGGRRPRSVEPKDLYTGKVWKFDAKKPTNVWDAVVKPFHEKWTDGAVDFLGVDVQETERTLTDISNTADDAETGRLLRIIAVATDLRQYEQHTLPTEIKPAVARLPEAQRKVIAAASKARREELKEKA